MPQAQRKRAAPLSLDSAICACGTDMCDMSDTPAMCCEFVVAFLAGSATRRPAARATPTRSNAQRAAAADASATVAASDIIPSTQPATTTRHRPIAMQHSALPPSASPHACSEAVVRSRGCGSKSKLWFEAEAVIRSRSCGSKSRLWFEAKPLGRSRGCGSKPQLSFEVEAVI